MKKNHHHSQLNTEQFGSVYRCFVSVPAHPGVFLPEHVSCVTRSLFTGTCVSRLPPVSFYRNMFRLPPVSFYRNMFLKPNKFCTFVYSEPTAHNPPNPVARLAPRAIGMPAGLIVAASTASKFDGGVSEGAPDTMRMPAVDRVTLHKPDASAPLGITLINRVALHELPPSLPPPPFVNLAALTMAASSPPPLIESSSSSTPPSQMTARRELSATPPEKPAREAKRARRPGSRRSPPPASATSSGTATWPSMWHVLVGAALLAFFVRGCLYSLVGEGLSDLLTSAAAVLAALVVADVLHPIARSLRVAFAELAARARWIVRAVRALLRGEPMPSLEQEADRIRCEMETAGLVDRGW